MACLLHLTSSGLCFGRLREVSGFSGTRVFSPRAMGKGDDRSLSTAPSKVRVPHVLTVAGSDSGAGAGIQADLKACAASGVYCSTVITAVTAQNTLGVQGVSIVADDFFGQQLKSVLDDMRPDVVKTGMLPSPGIVKVLCKNLKGYQARGTLSFILYLYRDVLPAIIPICFLLYGNPGVVKEALVVDPVMVSTSGDVLASPEMLASFRGQFLPMADIVTPNLKEASALLGGIHIGTVADMHHAAKSIQEFGPRNVLVKGGDLPDSIDAVDVLYDGKYFFEFRSQRVKTRNTHGTGCSLASFIAAELAKGSSMFAAVKVAKRFIETALDYSRDIHIGEGHQGPFDHLMKLKNNSMGLRPRRLFDPSDLLFYAVTDSRMNKKWGRSIGDVVEAAVNGGATIIQLREKDADTRDFLEAAKTCLGICRSHGVPFLINDRIDIAIACDADGVHVGQSDMPAHIARSVLGPDKIIGVSCKTPEQADKAWRDGADYIGCGGVYPTNTKENNITVGLDGLKEVCLASKLPVVGIGGISMSNARVVMALDVPNLEGVAVVSAIFDRASVFTEAQALRKLIMDSRKVVK